jgi:chlorobactene glucosyltransferase
VILLLSILPRLLLALLVPLLLWPRGPRIRSFAPLPAAEAPLVSVIVPARDEASNISTCIASLMNTLYPRREIIVVDDGSTDGTSDILQILAEHSDGVLRIVAGEPLPPGWLGKPWACWQGYRHAKGELLLFTDADTRHDDTLLGHAVGALHAHSADLLSVMPRQLMGSFWERLIQPQIFTMIAMRYYDLGRVNRSRSVSGAIANGQFLLIRRDVYETIGGHEALRGAVVEDQSIAQRVVATGHRLFVGHARDLMETRMYRSLRELVEGWTKNLALGSRQAVPGIFAPFTPWLIAAWIILIWILPPLIMVSAFFSPAFEELYAWSALATALSLVFWLAIYIRAGVSPLYALVYPVAALFTAGLFIRSALRGPRVEWKGRQYELEPAGVPPRDQDAAPRPS